MNEARAMVRNFRRHWVSGILIALALASSIAVVGTQESATSGELDARAQHLFQLMRTEEVSTLSIESGGQRVVIRKQSAPATAKKAAPSAAADAETDEETLEQTSAEWVQVEPLQGQVEVARVDELLRAARFATFLRRIAPEDVQRDAFGLTQPAHVLALQMGPVKYVVRIGGDAPMPRGSKYLELLGGDAGHSGVFVVSPSTARDLGVAPDAFQVRQIVPYAGSALRQLTFTRGAERLRIRQNLPGDFRFEGTFGGARVARDALDRLLMALARTQAEPLVAVDAARVQLARDALSVELTPTDPNAPSALLRFGGKCEGMDDRILALRESPNPIAGCIPKIGLRELISAPELLLDRGLFRLRSDEVEGFVVRDGAAKLEVLRDGEGFRMRLPVEGAVAADAGRARVAAMLSARGEWLEAPPSVPAAEAVHQVELSSAAATDADVITERVQFFSEASGTVLAHREADNAWLRLSQATMRAFAVDSLLIRESRLIDVDDSAVRAIAVRWGASRQELTQPERGKFELTIPAGLQADGGLAVAWVDSVRALSAEAWVAERDDGSFGLAPPFAEVKVTLNAGAAREFVIGARAGLGAFYAQERGQAAVFTLKGSVVEALTTWLLDRSGFMLDPELVEEFTLRTNRGSLAARKFGSEYVQTAGDFQLQPARLTALADLLALVRPEAAVAFDAADARYGFAKPLLEVRARLSDGSSRHWQVGVRDTYRDGAVYYARSVGQDAVYVVAQATIQQLFDAI